MVGTASAAQEAEGTADALVEQFRNPPDSARPRVWWHWLSGNVSKDGITKDLEWMRRIGLAGAMMFDGDMGAQQIVDKRITVLSPEWRQMVRHAATEADRLGLEFTMAAAPGWSETGGPWVQPSMAMKKFVWSETRANGGHSVGRLAALPDVVGPFQAFPKRDFAGKAIEDVARYSRDSYVLAFRAPRGDRSVDLGVPQVSSSDPTIDVRKLVDGDLETPVVLGSPSARTPVWVQYDFGLPKTLRSLTYVGPMGGRFSDAPIAELEASDDLRSWRLVSRLVRSAHNASPQRTFAFPATSARYFRVVFKSPEISRNPWPQAPGIPIAELALASGAKVDLFEDKAGFGVLQGAGSYRTPDVAAGATISGSRIIDVSDRLRTGGVLDWTPPAGEWIILRAGYSLTGQTNHPAAPEGTGLEVDKLDSRYVRAHLDAYLGPVLADLGPLVGRHGLQSLLTDSWEAGQANWTDNMVAEFRKRRGYDPRPFLPVLAGRVVDSAEQSDKFLWDFRRTIADLVADAHYGTIATFAREHGLQYYGEATGASMPTLADGIQSKASTDYPMAEFWEMPHGGAPAAYHGVPSDEFPADVIEARSAAHVYGKQIVAAEAFTSSLPQWTATPWKLKWVADKYMAMGINRLAIHTAPHQPDDIHRPGLSLGPFGQVFSRHESWAELAKPWIDYLARGSLLLQQGAPAADILVFYGEDAPAGVPYRQPGTPADLVGYTVDYTNADALLRLARVENGRIAFPGGASYALLVIENGVDRVTPALAKRLRELVAAGATIMGPKPVGSPSLGGDGSTVVQIGNELWVKPGAANPHKFGKGTVYWSNDLSAVVAAASIEPDFQSKVAPGMVLGFAHRHLGDGEIYFVTNQSEREGEVSLNLRVSGRVPEIWHAEDGRMNPSGYRSEGGRTNISLRMTAYQSVFVVLRKPTGVSQLEIPSAPLALLGQLPNSWTVRYGSRADAPMRTGVLAGTWTTDQHPEIRYYSGPALYRQNFIAPREWLASGQRLLLDIGAVGDVAIVRINGREAGGVWGPRQRLDVTRLVKFGTNVIEIEVANTWQNRLVGDLQPNASKHAWTVDLSRSPFPAFGPPLSRDTPLTPSGLLGTVTILAESTGPIQ